MAAMEIAVIVVTTVVAMMSSMPSPVSKSTGDLGLHKGYKSIEHFNGDYYYEVLVYRPHINSDKTAASIAQ
jgi:hypothetical protein